MKVSTGMVIPITIALHVESDSGRRWIGTGVQASRIPSPVIGGEGLAGNDAVLEGSTSEIGIVLKRHDVEGDNDENSSQTMNFFYPPKRCTILKSGLIPSYFLIG